MHILFLTDNFTPEVNAPASRTFEHCKEWVKAGHRVTVMTGVPNFPKGVVYPGYCNKLWQVEDMEGVRVIRVWTYIAANQGFARRIIDYMSFMLMAILASPWVQGVDVVIGTSPQLFTTCAAYAVSRLKRIPFVFELRDLWPESIKAVGAIDHSWVIHSLEKLELFLYRKAALIVSVTQSFRQNLIKRGIAPQKIVVVTNGVDLSRFSPQAKDEALETQLGLKNKFVLGYIGTHGMAHGLETLIEAAELLKNSAEGDSFRIIFLGDGARKQAIKQMALARRLDHLIFIDSVPKDEVVKYWSLLDASIIHLKKNDLFETVIPSKLFECMAMGIPVLHGVKGESAEIVEKNGVGLVFEAENPVVLCEKLEQLRYNSALYARLKRACIRAALHYDRTVLAEQMLHCLEATVASK